MNQQSDSTTSQLDQIVQTVQGSAKYRHLCPQVIRNVAQRELTRGRSGKGALKATKGKLHQVGAAYLDRAVNYERWTAELRRASKAGSREAMRVACQEIMKCQSSTRERLAILEQFYYRTLAGLPPIRSVVDIACGLNPLAVYWMPLSQDFEYYAYDIYEDMVEFLNSFLELAGIRGRAVAQDVTASLPTHQVDLALVLKGLPCLEQLDPAAGTRLLQSLPAQYMLFSFPVRSLGGRSKGMLEHYEKHFRDLIAKGPYSARRFEFPSELAFLVTRSELAAERQIRSGFHPSAG